jgi:hypothetical protein
VIAENRGGQLAAAQMFAKRWLAAQKTLRLEAQAFQTAQKALIEQPLRWLRTRLSA